MKNNILEINERFFMRKCFLKNKMCFSLRFLITQAGPMPLLDQYDEGVLDTSTLAESINIDRINHVYDLINSISVVDDRNFDSEWTGNGIPSALLTFDEKNFTMSSDQTLIMIINRLFRLLDIKIFKMKLFFISEG